MPDSLDATVFLGDSRVVLTYLPDESVSAIVTDPPYELTGNGKGGFMGHAWDASGVAFDQQLWAECLRVLKPGGHALVFGGSRTFHRVAVALEDAGFEMRDTISWTYACLTEDVEVLTPSGWRRGIDLSEGDTVAQWDPETGEISLTPVLETFVGPWEGDMVVFRNTDTDQVLTPNHRVFHQARQHRSAGGKSYHQWSDWQVKEAGDISRKSQIRLPLAGTHSGAGIGGTDYASLLGWVWTEGCYDKSGTGVRIYQTSANQAKCDEIAALMDRLGPHKRYDRVRDYAASHEARKRLAGGVEPKVSGCYTESTWFFSGELALRVRDDLPGKHPDYRLLWRMTSEEKEAFLDAALRGDGSRSTTTWSFYQSNPADREWFVTLLSLMNRRGHNYAYPNAAKGGAVSITPRGVTNVSRKALSEAVEHYEGRVWCVRVKTGAFVARRNGKVFITGNSGMPKSHNLEKAAVKAGVDAAPFAGWGSALKPAWEPILVARKPLDGTLLANATVHGTGGLNIDATRIGTGDRFGGGAKGTSGFAAGYEGGAGWVPGPVAGRWPANVVLGHSPDCAVVGSRSEDVVTNRFTQGAFPFGGAEGQPYESESKAASTPVYDCVPGCPVTLLDVQSGQVGAAAPASGPTLTGGHKSTSMAGAFKGTDAPPAFHADKGGASRMFHNAVWLPVDLPPFLYCAKAPKRERVAVDGVTHPTQKPLTLMRWLVRLVTPAGGVVLDPFAGSGATLEAALEEGFTPVGVELTADYVPSIAARVTRAGGVLDVVDADGAAADAV